MIAKLKQLRIDLGEILSYYPTEYAIYKQKMIAGNYVAFFLRGAPDIIRFPFESEEARDAFLEELDAELKTREIDNAPND